MGHWDIFEMVEAMMKLWDIYGTMGHLPTLGHSPPLYIYRGCPIGEVIKKMSQVLPLRKTKIEEVNMTEQELIERIREAIEDAWMNADHGPTWGEFKTNAANQISALLKAADYQQECCCDMVDCGGGRSENENP